LSDKDWWSRRFRRRWSFFRGFGDIDEIFKEMEEMMEKEFKDLSRKAPRDLIQERKLPDGTKVKSSGPFVYGYSVKIGPDGKPEFREFGNIKPERRLGRPRIDIKEKREPLVDTITTNGEVKVIVELPGVQKEDIRLHTTENALTISVDTPQRKYFKGIELPTKISPKEAKASYKNGVLDVTLQKKKEEKPKGESIRIK
jgi:HSP20 family protein